ncbi:DnaJ domain-containing protein [bacterium]|nr:DnaJ domain-containing protein [bacterium]
MFNYYDVLQVEHKAVLTEIKRSFRSLLKQFHPDCNRNNAAWAAQQTRRLVEAYHVLSDARRRKHHDHQLRLHNLSHPSHVDSASFNGGESGTAGRCRQVLTDLLDGRGRRAIDAYEALRGEERAFDFYPHLSLKDHLDCKFLLGEEYERQEELEQALILYEDVYNEELEGPRLRYFFDEVRDRIVTIYCQHLPRLLSAEEVIGHFKHALRLELPPKERAEIRKRLAETLLKVGNDDEARDHLLKALQLRPSLKGVQRLCARLKIPIETPAVTPSH